MKSYSVLKLLVENCLSLHIALPIGHRNATAAEICKTAAEICKTAELNQAENVCVLSFTY